MTEFDQVLGEFADAWNTGRRPRVADYLERVPESRRDELADAIAAWLEVAPQPDYDDATLQELAQTPALAAAFAAADRTALPWPARLRAVRERAGLAIAEVAERLTATLGLGDPARAASYLERAEDDDLDERRISRRLIAGLASVLGADADELEPAWGRAAAPAAQFFRAEEVADRASLEQQFDALSRAAAAPAPARELDELDRLFVGGPEA
jgi:transcriptional regulator with XRE-family HTH domain